MIAILTCILVFALTVTIARWILTAPLVRTLSASIDGWADGVHGEGASES